MTDENTLREEIYVFEKHKENWLRSNLGNFVLVFGAKVVGFYFGLRNCLQGGS